LDHRLAAAAHGLSRARSRLGDGGSGSLVERGRQAFPQAFPDRATLDVTCGIPAGG
jgi:hypothetical protein